MKKNCLDYALEYLKIPKTEYQLRLQLLKKKYWEDEIENTINYLKKEKFLDDKKYAQMYFESEVMKKWKPIYVIKSKLYQKWVDKEYIKEVIDKFEDEINEWIQKWIQKEINKLKSRWYEWFDIIQKLSRKWYKIDDIKSAL